MRPSMQPHADRLGRSALILASLLTACWTSLAGAQQRVALVHGINSNGATWNTYEIDLRSRGYLTTAPSLPAHERITTQAGILAGALWNVGFRDPGTILIAHSQGGLISRMMSRSFPFRGLVTIGTPHHGAPIAGKQRDVQNWMYAAGAEAATLTYLNDAWYQHEDYWFQCYIQMTCWSMPHPQWAMDLSLWAIGFTETVGQVALQHMLGSQPVLEDLLPFSGLQQDLNGSPAREMVTNRLAYQADILSGYDGGPFRLKMDGPSADAMGAEAYYNGAFLMYLGYDYITNASGSPAVWELLIGGGAAVDLGYRLMNLGPWWSYDIVGSGRHDGIVPWQNQQMPNAISFNAPGLSHTQETNHGTARNYLTSGLSLILGM